MTIIHITCLGFLTSWLIGGLYVWLIMFTFPLDLNVAAIFGIWQPNYNGLHPMAIFAAFGEALLFVALPSTLIAFINGLVTEICLRLNSSLFLLLTCVAIISTIGIRFLTAFIFQRQVFTFAGSMPIWLAPFATVIVVRQYLRFV